MVTVKTLTNRTAWRIGAEPLDIHFMYFVTDEVKATPNEQIGWIEYFADNAYVEN